MSDDAPDPPTLYINGETIVFTPGTRVDVYVKCRCRRAVRIQFAMAKERPHGVSAGTFHQGSECGWYLRTSPEAFITERGGDIVRGGTQ